MFIAKSKLQRLSPNGKSQMWDAEADGYARGEVTCCFMLKLLGDAVRDGDHVEWVIRDSGVNSDERTQRITILRPSVKSVS